VARQARQESSEIRLHAADDVDPIDDMSDFHQRNNMDRDIRALEAWPGRHRRSPRRSDGSYLLLSSVADSLREAADRYLSGDLDILDVGCEDKPYYPLFAARARTYLGTDVVPGPLVDRVCPVESLDVDSSSIDLVLCAQVLEHVRDPAAGLREIGRVLRPGGFAFVTTHGTYPFHPHPTDYWRWTPQGFDVLIESADALSLRELVAHRGTAACLALLAATYVEIFTTHAHIQALGRPLIRTVNAVGELADRASPRLWHPQPMSLVANYLLVLERATDPA
jgi:SAM-dependent methyltransferase